MTSMAEQCPSIMSVAEFLTWNDGTDRRYELIDGHVRAMAPPAPEHSTIVGNIAAALQPRLEHRCRARIEYGIRLAGDDLTYFPADLAIVRAEIRRSSPPTAATSSSGSAKAIDGSSRTISAKAAPSRSTH